MMRRKVATPVGGAMELWKAIATKLGGDFLGELTFDHEHLVYQAYAVGPMVLISTGPWNESEQLWVYNGETATHYYSEARVRDYLNEVFPELIMEGVL